ncbi:transglycosylase SLT domain-containing protein [Nocardia nova SH22a]|uniref:Transglycosylase SLT domain-containing protein n=1 Tax=Nocardia nova SH22a TaxID=1415166 RepID=W5TB97_9NOCA|nr:DUF4226 domain-containing protein [Nocardia nova]AHH16399.1 transglycosylase SLT domain-containing protein [Nocardia nova SH22a]
MTSADTQWETESGDADATESDDHAEALPASTTPWTRPNRRERDQRNPTAPLPPGSADNAPAVTDSSRPPVHAVPAAAEVAASPAPSSPWSAARAPTPAVQTGPSQSGHDAGLGGRVPTAAPAVSATAAPARPSPGGTLPAQVDPGPADPGVPDPASPLGPAQSTMGMLPMLASALAGLGKKNGSGTTEPTGSDDRDGALPPEAQQARDALQKLKDTYGDDSKASAESRSVPRKKQLDTKSGPRTRGSGKTAAQVRRNQLYQRNVAGAFNNLDNDLIDYMRSLDGKHTVDKNAVAQLLREVDIQLARIGPAAYTKAGAQQVHRILIKALLQATRIVTGSTGVSRSGAAEINRLTKQYVYNLAGKQYGKASGGSGGTGTATTVGGSVGQWIQQAMKVLQDAGYDTGRMDPEAIAMIIQHESGGNPSATNNWDSNAAKGTPSIGLMQTIGPTFNSHALPGHTNIYDPVDNIVAGVRYAISRYGSVSNVPGVVAVRSGGSYRGY